MALRLQSGARIFTRTAMSAQPSIVSTSPRISNGNLRIGIAGWAVPADYRLESSARQTHLQQYSHYFNAVEINSSFYRPHRRATYQRWRDSVPSAFRFAVKVPKLITHERRLIGCADEIAAFVANASGLGEKLAVLLVQLPPSLAFEENAAREFLQLLTHAAQAKIVWEARNPSWFMAGADDLFDQFDIVRVRAHPVPKLCPDPAPEDADFLYLRLHGAPRMYYSSYPAEFLDGIRSDMATGARAETWCIFDNTAEGAAWPNARRVQDPSISR
jgi:uncharacterized protein YecE (DUF72 family)